LGGLIPLSDASRRPARLPVVTAFIIVVNVFVFLLELVRGDAFVLQWSAIPAQIRLRSKQRQDGPKNS
jgi:membrane associated rhomboid family serine protease